jgi:hypothetical protein
MRNLWCFLGTVLCFLFVAQAGAANFVLLDTIAPSDVAAQDEFGGRFVDTTAVSVDGSTLLASSWQADCAAGPDCGAAYVFVRTPGGWVQQARLTGPDSAPGDQFMEVALSGDGNLALVGAGKADCAVGSDCGAVYFFVRNGTAWSFQQKLTPSDPGAGDSFGSALSLSSDGTVAVIGAFQDNCGVFFGCGSAYAFERSGNTWTETQKFSGDPNPSAFFGGTVVLSKDGNTALINGDVFGGLVAGRAYVFTRSAGVWSFQTKLAPLATAFSFAFNMDVSADGNVALVQEDNFASQDFVYVFTRAGTVWSLETRLPNASSGAGVGVASQLALSDDGETAAIKSTRVCSGSTCQVAHIFRRNQGAWNLFQTLSAANFVDPLEGGSVDISGDAQIVLVADPGAPCASGSNCGVAHLFGTLSPLEDVPAASHLGLALLALLLAASGAWVLARRRRSA